MNTAAIKSSPLIEETPGIKPQRSSKTSSQARDSLEYQNHKIPNPYYRHPNSQGESANSLPPGLVQQISGLQFLTPSLLEKIQWSQALCGQRRSSGFARNLEAMQRAAREQQCKVGVPRRAKVCFNEKMSSEGSISMDQLVEEDIWSQDSRHRWALQPEQFLGDGLFPINEHGGGQFIQFYSMTELWAPNTDAYFDIGL